jgi:urease accessory protein
MIQLTRKVTGPAKPQTTVSLTLDRRVKSRLRVMLDDGREAGVLLPRGETLKDGDCLASEDGLVVRVIAAPERVSTVATADPLLLARACYHLGNRHVALQIEPGRLRYLHDRVLDDLVRGLGLAVTVEQAPFEPEPGAYGGSAHGHRHEQGREQRHEHGHGHHGD